MTIITLPALIGTDPLGFLAAAGTLRLIADHHDPDATLSFDRGTGVAQVQAANMANIDDVVAALQSVADSLDDHAVPLMPADFPPPGAAPDGLRVPPAALPALAARWSAATGEPERVAMWMRGLVTDLATDDKGRAAMTPLVAPSGKQSFSTMYLLERRMLRDRPTALTEALTGWRRVPGCTGEYLDYRVLMSKADAATAKAAKERGVPGATWLAIMAFPMFPVVGVGSMRLAPGWQALNGRPIMRWPLWSDPANVPAVRMLLNHPALGLYTADRLASPTGARKLRRLSVFLVATASRAKIYGRKSDGVLVPRAVIPV